MARETELQEIIERQLREQRQMEERLAALSAHMKHLEEDLDTARKDLLQSKDRNRKLEQDVRKVSDCSCVCCPEVECGFLVLRGSQPWDGCVSKSRALERPQLAASLPLRRGLWSRRGLVQAVRWQWTNMRAALTLCCTLGVDSSFPQVLGGPLCSFSKNSFIHSFIYWRIVALHCCVNFCCTAK